MHETPLVRVKMEEGTPRLPQRDEGKKRELENKEIKPAQVGTLQRRDARETAVPTYNFVYVTSIPTTFRREKRALSNSRCHFPLIVMARQLSLDWMLPIGFYRACQAASPAQIIEGFHGVELASKVKIRLIASSSHLETTAVNGVLDFLWTPLVIDGCTSPQKCTNNRVSCRRATGVYCVEYKDLPAAIHLEMWRPSNWERLNVCGVCLATMKDTHKEAMQGVWDELPEMFDLPAWLVLESMRVAAFE
ncbi:hypothetical protein C8R43DRAFT_1039382 [Mycena crocata]|nr:hypothetical protein C8R43DRAFT_1039382 [Mycena crocata]